KHIQKKEPILIHCLAGCGRTGLMLAVAERFIYGSSAEKAIRKVRQSRPCAIENSIQEEFVRNYKRKNFHLSLLKKILTRK
ncbi:MAG: protein-tyrosine phosphatase family protein, partial [Asgard group archaeon]|nr:protein-tyrosine phosphatase family protein [Asgard group archaeon]